ncbi:MAG: tRNA-specific adenosine deaminase [Pseudomonadota bacterium]
MNHVDAMKLALEQAQLAQAAGEVPIGAVVIKDGSVIGRGFNQTIGQADPCAHAEVLALREAAQSLGNYRLDDCTLVVTVEPCTMCAGAALNARIGRVVYGAAEAKTGAAGSVHDVFAQSQINHHTQVQGGVEAEACAAIMQAFFHAKRERFKAREGRLRDDALRTPEVAFEGLPDWAFEPNYIDDLPSLNGLRMAYLDEGPRDAATTWLLLHGNPTWSYIWRHWVPRLTALGHRVVAPDLIGFGRSDKPKKMAQHTYDWHRQVLLEWIDRLDLRRVTLAVQDWGGLLGLTLPMAAPERYEGLCVMNTTLATGERALPDGFVAWRQFCRDKPQFGVGDLLGRGCRHLSREERAAYDAPFPDSGHRAALRRFPEMVMGDPDAPGAALSREAAVFWSEHWQGKAAMVIGDADPVLASEMPLLHAKIKGCATPIHLPDGGHFVQEWLHPSLDSAWFDHLLVQLR